MHNNYWTSIHPLYILQKKAIRIIKVGYRDYIHVLFLQSRILKLRDQIAYQTPQIMFTARTNLLLGNIQSRLNQREGIYNLS